MATAQVFRLGLARALHRMRRLSRRRAVLSLCLPVALAFLLPAASVLVLVLVLVLVALLTLVLVLLVALLLLSLLSVLLLGSRLGCARRRRARDGRRGRAPAAVEGPRRRLI